MAELVVGFLIEKLGSKLVQEGQLLTGVRKEVQYIKEELESIQAFLKDADARGESEHVVKVWVQQVRDLAYDVEDVLDEFVLRIAQDRKGGFVGFIRKKTRFLKELKRRHDLSIQMQEIKTRVCEIKERSERYKFSSSDQGTSSDSMDDLRVAALFVEEAEIVGIDQPRDKLLSWLIEGESRRKAFAVVGMGGLGKTTLVKKVYDNQRVMGHFECRAWVTVSKSFRVQELLRAMVKQFCEARRESLPEGFETMEQVQYVNKVREYLLRKRYVVIFDDVWNMDLWNSIQYALPLNDFGSRIIITTRSSVVASHLVDSANHVYNLQPLSSEEAWKLFCNKAFGGHCPPELEEWSHKVVKICEGTPLIIVAIGGLLSRKNRIPYELKKLHDSIGHELETNPFLTSMTRVLSLSYNDLPHHLKSCFRYLSIFPEDYGVKNGTLIRLWIAEGFIKETRGKTLEEVAEDYLNELIQRNLLQVATFHKDGRQRSTRVHDVFREISLSKSEEERFCKILVENNISLACENMRRISVHNCGNNVQLHNLNFSHVRSLFIFRVEKLLNDNFMRKLMSNFKLLRVLDLEDAPIENFQDEILNLLHLRYLSFRSTKIRVLPKSLGKLQNLETLDLRDTSVEELPTDIQKLQKLRYLRASRSESWLYGVKVHKGIGCLTALQKLALIEANSRSTQITKELGNLNRLRRLGITKLRREDGTDLCTSIQKMNDLRSLRLDSIHDEELLDLQSMSSPPLLLRRLWLRGCLEKLPDWISLLHNLIYLGLFSSRLSDDPIRVLQSLPNLVVLVLSEAHDAEQLCFEAKGFQRLKELSIYNFDKLNLVKVESCALPVLQELSIGSCQQLKKLPLGIRHLESLMYLYFFNMPEEFEWTILCSDDGENNYKQVEHIPDVSFTAILDGSWVSFSREEFHGTMTQLQMESNSIDSKSFDKLFSLTKQALLSDPGNWLRSDLMDLLRYKVADVGG